MASDIESALILRMEATLTKFERQLEKGRNSARTTAFGIQRDFDRMGNRIDKSSVRAAAGITRFLNLSGRGRFVLQNTANQIGDIAVQLEGGTSAARVMGQQMPQLLGGFAALGGVLGTVAPLLGTVAAIGIPLAVMLMRNGDNAEDAAEKVKTFAEKLNDAHSALQRAESALATASAGGIEDLRKKYGDVTQAILELNRALIDIEARAAKTSVGAVIEDVVGTLDAEIGSILGAIGSALVEGTGEGLEEAKRQLADFEANVRQRQSAGMVVDPSELAQLQQMREEVAFLAGDFEHAADIAAQMKLSPELNQQISDAKNGLLAAKEAGDFTAVADGFALLRDLLEQTGQEIDQGLLDHLVQGEDMARQMAARFAEAEAAVEGLVDDGSGIAGALQPGVDAAAALAKNLGISLELAQQLERTGYERHVGGGRGGDPRQSGGRFNDWQTYVPAVQLAYQPGGSAGVPLPTSGTSRGGGGGQSEIEQLKRQYEQLRATLDPVWKATQDYADAQKALNWALQSGEIDGAQYNALLDDAREKFLGAASAANEFKTIANAIGGALERAFDVLFDMTASAEDKMEALKGIAYDLVQELLKALVLKPFISGLTDWMGGGTFSMPGFDGGGYTGSAARSGGLDGKGGFLAMMHPQETVIDHTKGQRQSGGGVTVEQHIHVSTGVAQTVRAEMISLLPQMKQVAIAAVGNEMKRTHRA